MKKVLGIFVLILSISYATNSCAITDFAPTQSGTQDTISKLCFSNPCFENLLVQAIDNAKKTIDISLYGFRDEATVNALIRAKEERGVRVRLVSELDSEGESGWAKLLEHHFYIVFGNSSKIMHNKYVLIDDTFLVTGSTNLTNGMNTHFNNMILIKSPTLVAVFKQDFERMYTDLKFGNSKDDGGFCPAGMRAYTDPGIKVGRYEIWPYFTPYSDCYLPYGGCENDLPTVPGEGNGYDAGGRGAGQDDERDKNPDPPDDGSYVDYTNAMGRVVLPHLAMAQKEIIILSFSFTDKWIMYRLKEAHDRGVKVQVYQDEGHYNSQKNHSGEAIESLRAKIKDYFLVKKRENSESGILHHKVIIIDGHTIILGSMNFSVSGAGGGNDENFLLIKNAGPIVSAFKQDISKMARWAYRVPAYNP